MDGFSQTLLVLLLVGMDGCIVAAGTKAEYIQAMVCVGTFVYLYSLVFFPLGKCHSVIPEISLISAHGEHVPYRI